MVQLVKQNKIIPIPWECTVFLLANFTLALVGKNKKGFDIEFVTPTLDCPYL